MCLSFDYDYLAIFIPLLPIRLIKSLIHVVKI